MRLGPSASEAAALVDEEKLVQVVKSLSHIKEVVSDPNMRKMLQNLAPKLLDALGDDHEVERAKNGLPSSARVSKPTPSAVPPNPPVVPSSKTAPPAPAPKHVDPPALSPHPSPTSAGGSGDGSGGDEGKEINSSTHRAAHARLARRMSSCDPVKFPQMTKLWSGTRKERLLFSIFQSKKTK